MTNEITIISPESLEVASLYLQYGNIPAVAQELQISQFEVTEQLNKREVKKYIDNVYLDVGWRNKNNIASVMDTIIQSKLAEADETQEYTKKDLPDLMMMAHKMRMDEIKALESLEKVTIAKQQNIQINEGGSGLPGGSNYKDLLEKIMTGNNNN